MDILLIRHGKPRSAHSDVVNAVDYVKWVRKYNFSDVAINSRPDSKHSDIDGFYRISSDFNRAIHSCEIYTGKSPDEIDTLYKEMDIPRYKLPLKFKPMTWVYICRLFWMFGKSGPFESYKLAKQRAELAVDELIKIAQSTNKVVLFGHGFMNLHIRRALVKKGWAVHSKNNSYWGETHLSINAL